MSLSHQSTKIRHSKHYAWSTRDVLGKGASGTVYKGVDRNTGKPVAVKTFTQALTGYQEYEVLLKINHKNIVQFLAIENDDTEVRSINKPVVIITELCSGGCLEDILNQPENNRGLNDSDFLSFLRDLHDGVKYLRDNNNVHRDLKPGNIMKFIQDDGSPVYKLIDFGAARELPDGQAFKSLYGTEEYIAPDMYRKAFLRHECLESLKFGPTVDLWSIGVTLYHVATGDLPFKPYGGRANEDKSIMHYITSNKATGIISGIQKEPQGRIHWGTELPTNCLLSAGLKNIVTPLLAGLMESDHQKIWNFEKFFSETENILTRTIVHIFYVNLPSMLKIYLQPSATIKELQSEIFTHTGVAERSRLLIHKSSLYCSNEIPSTSEECPLFLFCKKDNKVFVPILQKLANTVNFTRPVNSLKDISLADASCSDGHQAKRQIEEYFLYSKLICQVVDELGSHLKHTCSLLNNFMDKANVLRKISLVLKKSEIVVGEVADFNENQLKVAELHKKYILKDFTTTEWKAFTGTIKHPFKTRAVIKAKLLVEQLEESRRRLRHTQRDSLLSEVDQHMVERRKFRGALNRLIGLMENEVYPQYKALCQRFEYWFKTVQEDISEIDRINESIKTVQANVQSIEERLDDILAGNPSLQSPRETTDF